MTLSAEGDTGHKGLIQDHAYVQRDPWAWWSVCKVCALAEAAHAHSTRPPFTEEETAAIRGEEIYCSGCGIHLTEHESGTCRDCEREGAGS
jgi:hypothetical protein